MQTQTTITTVQQIESQANLAAILAKAEETCQKCHPLTPITCTTDCKIWKLKNQSLKLYEKMRNPDYMGKLLNVLKNKRRLQVLEVIAKSRSPITRLQKELRRKGYDHSQKTITDEYISPLVEIGLAEESRGQYYATMFGCRLNDLMKDCYIIEDVLPPHSECYEENALGMLIDKPKTYEDLKHIIPETSVARVLNRLQTAELVEAREDKDYIFYFKTRRDSGKERLSPTEMKIYESLSPEGVSARKLAEKSRISLRRVYKYLRKLRGKKLVFAKEVPKAYSLTELGFQIARRLEGVHVLAVETLSAIEQLFKGGGDATGVNDGAASKHKKKTVAFVPFTILRNC